jgi:predicted nucleic acid-binding Zn ribbon protein
MQPARPILKKIVTEIVRGEGADGPLLAWPMVCGAKIAERTRAISFDAGVLTVTVSDEAWRRQLQSFLPQYLAALNQLVAERVSDIQFRTVQPQP